MGSFPVILRSFGVIWKHLELLKRDACSWKGQLESFKLESLKSGSFAEVGKSQAKSKKNEQSWKEPSKVEKNRAKLERAERSWKVFLKLENLNELGKL